MISNETERLGLGGATVTGLYVDDGEHALKFDTDRGEVIWLTDADCCSETWFADVIGVEHLIGHPVGAILSQIVPVDDDRTRQEVDSQECLTIITGSGQCDIYWRNSSNGYYGGSVYRLGDIDDLWHSVIPESVAQNATWEPITDNWRAP